jgi:hypothetical protein
MSDENVELIESVTIIATRPNSLSGHDRMPVPPAEVGALWLDPGSRRRAAGQERLVIRRPLVRAICSWIEFAHPRGRRRCLAAAAEALGLAELGGRCPGGDRVDAVDRLQRLAAAVGAGSSASTELLVLVIVTPANPSDRLYTWGARGTRSDGDRRARSHCYGRAARGSGSARAAGRAARGGAGRAAARAGEDPGVGVRAHGRARLRGADRRLAGLVRRREGGAPPPLLAPLPHRLAAAARDGRRLPATRRLVRRLVEAGPSTAARCAALRLSVRTLRLDRGHGGGELRPGRRLAARGDRRRRRPGLAVGQGRRVRAWLARSSRLPGAALPPARPARSPVLPLPARCRR